MILDRFKLDGQVALVTGASRGLGQAMARGLAEAGANLAVCSRHQDEIDAVAEEIRAATGRAVLALEVDVTDREQVEAFVERTLAEFGQIDILVNNAGINRRVPLLELDDATWQEVLDINLTGPMYTCRAVGPHMIKRKYGRIINVASTLALVSIPNRTPYAASKAGLALFTKTIALEWGPHGVTANALCPGPFDTPLNASIKNDPVAYQQFLDKIPLGRWGDPRELACAVVFLASPASSFMTGALVLVDGGWTVL
jgi:NAD(P)-dependent dehydrogenase (short-subunit alcohol dehydrogenase family)